MKTDTSIQFEVRAEALLAASHFATKEESRPILQGILIEKAGPNACVVGTDGHTMLAYCYGRDGDVKDNGPETDLILVADWRRLKVKSLTVPAACFRRGVGPGEWQILTYGRNGAENILNAREVEGPYPQWRQVMPREDELGGAIGAIELNLGLAARFAKSFGERANLTFLGDPKRALVVRNGNEPNMLGLWMPKQLDDRVNGSLPGWARYRTPAEAAKKAASA